MAGYSIIFGHK